MQTKSMTSISISSGNPLMNFFSWINPEKFGCHHRSYMSWLASAISRTSINCCHLRKHVARIRQQPWFFPFTFTHRTVWFIAIQVTISIQRIQTTIKRYTIWNNMRTKRVPSVGRWQRIYIEPNWNRSTMLTFGRILEISTIIWAQIRPKLPHQCIQNCNFAKKY